MSFLDWERSGHEFALPRQHLGRQPETLYQTIVLGLVLNTFGCFGSSSPWGAASTRFIICFAPRDLPLQFLHVWSAQTTIFLGWARSDQLFSGLGALKPRVFSAGSAQTMSFLGWERSNHEFSQLGVLRP